MKYRKKPVVIDVVQFFNGDGKNTFSKCLDFVQGKADLIELCNGEHVMVIRTLEGEITASDGDFIIRGIQGEFYPCKPDIFKQTYEPIEGE